MTLEEKTLKVEHRLLFHKVKLCKRVFPQVKFLHLGRELLPRLAEYSNPVDLRATLSKNFVDITNSPPQLMKGPSLDTSIPFEANETCILLEFTADKSMYPIPVSGGKFGRQADNDIVLSDDDISRKHAELFFLDNKFYLKDLKSTVGTLINLDGKIAIEKGMRFQIGRSYILSILDLKNSKLRLKIERDDDEDFEEEEKDQELDFSKIGVNKGVIIGKSSEAHIKLKGNKKDIKDHHCMIYLNNQEEILLEDQNSDSGYFQSLCFILI